MPQAEYEREAIEWSYIEFVDNQDVLDLVRPPHQPHLRRQRQPAPAAQAAARGRAALLRV